MLCTNRDLATELPHNASLQTEEPGPIAHIRCLRKPTRSGYPPLGGASRWALLSNVSLNHLSLSDEPAALDALKKILSLYSLSPSPATQQQIDSIQTMTVRKVMRRVGNHPWKGFRAGYEIQFTFSESSPQQSPVLFRRVLSSFLQLHGSLNSSVRVLQGEPN